MVAKKDSRHHPRKDLGWTGMPKRLRGGWAMEICIPRTRFRLWIGKFHHALQAALAYDAVMFYFCGEHLPRQRRFNFLVVPRPSIPDQLRTELTIGNIKAIAAYHGRSYAGFYAPLMCPILSAAPPVLPLMVPAVAADDVATTAGAGNRPD